MKTIQKCGCLSHTHSRLPNTGKQSDSELCVPWQKGIQDLTQIHTGPQPYTLQMTRITPHTRLKHSLAVCKPSSYIRRTFFVALGATSALVFGWICNGKTERLRVGLFLGSNPVLTSEEEKLGEGGCTRRRGFFGDCGRPLFTRPHPTQLSLHLSRWSTCALSQISHQSRGPSNVHNNATGWRNTPS